MNFHFAIHFICSFYIITVDVEWFHVSNRPYHTILYQYPIFIGISIPLITYNLTYVIGRYAFFRFVFYANKLGGSLLCITVIINVQK